MRLKPNTLSISWFEKSCGEYMVLTKEGLISQGLKHGDENKARCDSIVQSCHQGKVDKDYDGVLIFRGRRWRVGWRPDHKTCQNLNGPGSSPSTPLTPFLEEELKA
ncbi:hypothetical protein PoB_001472700 [Plakobranchus ocellatus]|uniref:Uncharacterized protein n=1 Tax=Plakobranchus ocellatus TaxID=259542 RepID=A0AAV3Z160_9GAST|nr:hypothetical protein PoB_001472700 [Plakobranchus ocellatus]